MAAVIARLPGRAVGHRAVPDAPGVHDCGLKLVAGSAISGFPPRQIGGRLGHRLDDLPRFGDQPIVQPPDIDYHDSGLGAGQPPLDGDALSAAWGAIARVLRAHEPFPALVIDRRWNIVMTNRAIEPFLADVAPDLLRPPINMVRLGLDPRGLAPRIVNLAEMRSLLRTRITRQLATAPDPELTALYEELLAPGFDDTSHPIESEVAIPMIFRFGGREIRLFSTTTTFGTPMDITLDEVAVESYYPTDAESAAYFTRSDVEARSAG
ncbi:hypothetical protein ABZU75_40640 [Streptosporangium sp. NPDC005286]|uniref:MmyB family transcriptional regulator n=1 Tax=Streptosporangium sp. NPDC005286 TaxID=3154463 RepID=UPI0033A8E9B3